MKFKVGDKVEFVQNKGTKVIGDIVTVTKVETFDDETLLHWKDGVTVGSTFAYRVKLAEPKKTKNQRIAELEKKVEELEGNSFGDYEAIEGLKQDWARYKDGYLQDSRKVLDMILTLSKKVESLEFVLAEKSKLTSTDVICEWDSVMKKSELTPNQQRAEIIEKAKKFVEEHAVSKAGADGFNYASIDGWITYTEFVVNTEKRTVVLLAKGVHTHRVHHRSIAKCNPSDVFNEHIGKAIALGRALGIDVSEFENVVQPCELVVGQVCEIFDWDGHNGKHTKITRVFDGGKANHSYYAGWFDKNNLKIINDTNAIY